ncbi:MAG: tRNA (adenosine(37)-N6)-dimethylallyltransferase MiaA [Chloroflexi bacterium]|nr:tRNA (adenosine(37)-N6)-dimethylallyltransferase MiaA [Chloroflexota bacterium]
MTGDAPPLIIILGPTGVGKTELAISLAGALGGEIIGADSRQIYKFMDIGTAKPTAAQQARIPHHLIDIVPPDYNLSLAEYLDAAVSAIEDVHQRGNIPLLVGGSGQYISAVEEGWSIPRVPPDPELRAELERYAAANSRAALHERLQAVDPVAAERIHPNNTRRVIRALEVQALTGRAISALQVKRPPPWRIRRLGLQLPRSILYPRVDARVDAMLEAGLVDEVAGLLEMGYDRALPSMSGLGYREIAAHLLDGSPLDEAIERTKFSTHEFIRGQDVWFRGHDNGILWHNVEDVDAAALACNLGDWLERGDRATC